MVTAALGQSLWQQWEASQVPYLLLGAEPLSDGLAIVQLRWVG